MRNYININLKDALVLIFYPVLLSFVLEVTLQSISFSTYLNLLENVLFGTIIFFLLNQLAVFSKNIWLFGSIIGFYYLFLLFETGLYLLFQTRINAAYIYVILNTNYNEALEFSLVFYKENLAWLLLFFMPLFRFFPKQLFKDTRYELKGVFFNLFIVFILLSVVKYADLTKWNSPYVFLKSYIQYENQLKSFEDYNSLSYDISVETETDNETVVVIIGESTSQQHMSLYGYSRKTTPKLEQIRDSLLVYRNIISSHVYTTGSLFDAFTLSNYENPELNQPLLAYLKKAGYKVYWLSNQRPVGLNDNLISKIASSAHESFFLSYNDFRHTTLYDDVLLPRLEEKLKERSKKVIFVHLIGTHYAYDKRYPEEFDIFKSEPKHKKTEVIDTYDNAVLYNDYVVSEIFNMIKEKGGKSAVLYFSDHGEEVYDTVDYFGHFEDNPTPAMFEIPFLLYTSPKFEKPKDFIVNESRAYMLDDFPHSLTHLLGIKSPLLESSRSVFSRHFLERKRLISDTIDYDTFKIKFEK